MRRSKEGSGLVVVNYVDNNGGMQEKKVTVLEMLGKSYCHNLALISCFN